MIYNIPRGGGGGGGGGGVRARFASKRNSCRGKGQIYLSPP